MSAKLVETEVKKGGYILDLLRLNGKANEGQLKQCDLNRLVF